MVKKSKGQESKQYTLADFIREQMRMREMPTEREFAAFVGISHSTVHKHLNTPDRRVSIDFLERLSSATGTSLEALIMIVSPHFAKQSHVDPHVLVIAEQLGGIDKDTLNLMLTLALSHKPKGDSK